MLRTLHLVELNEAKFRKHKPGKGYQKGDYAKEAHGVEHPGDPDPEGSREIARRGQEQDVLRARGSGQPITNYIEGKTKTQSAGDPELEAHVRDFAKKHGVPYKEVSMEPPGPSSKSGRKVQKIAQSYDYENPTDDHRLAYYKDFGGKSNKLSRKVKKRNQKRARHFEKVYYQNKQDGGVSTSVVGSGMLKLENMVIENMVRTLHLVEINETRSGFTGDRDRDKLRDLSTNLRRGGSSEIEIQNHLRGWLKKRGKMHYHGTPYKFEGLPKSNAEQRGEEGEDFSDNAVHVGTLKSAQERLGNRDMSVESDADKPITPRIIPLTVNVDKDSHPLGSTSAPFRDGTASNFGKNVTTRDSETGESSAARLPLSHLTPPGSSNGKGYKEVTPRANQNTVVYRNGVEDKGNNSYSTNKPKRTLRSLHDLANQQESLSLGESNNNQRDDSHVSTVTDDILRKKLRGSRNTKDLEDPRDKSYGQNFPANSDGTPLPPLTPREMLRAHYRQPRVLRRKNMEAAIHHGQWAISRKFRKGWKGSRLPAEQAALEQAKWPNAGGSTHVISRGQGKVRGAKPLPGEVQGEELDMARPVGEGGNVTRNRVARKLNRKRVGGYQVVPETPEFGTQDDNIDSMIGLGNAYGGTPSRKDKAHPAKKPIGRQSQKKVDVKKPPLSGTTYSQG